MGHDCCGVVVEVGSGVRSLRPGPFVVGAFRLPDNTCPPCQAGVVGQQRAFLTGAQAP